MANLWKANRTLVELTFVSLSGNHPNGSRSTEFYYSWNRPYPFHKRERFHLSAIARQWICVCLSWDNLGITHASRTIFTFVELTVSWGMVDSNALRNRITCFFFYLSAGAWLDICKINWERRNGLKFSLHGSWEIAGISVVRLQQPPRQTFPEICSRTSKTPSDLG